MKGTKRVVTGLLVGAGVVGLVAFDHFTQSAWATCTLLALLIAGALREAYLMLAAAGHALRVWPPVIATFALLALRAGASELQLEPAEARAIVVVGLGALMIAPLVAGIARGPGPDGPQPKDLVRAGLHALPLAWVGLLGSFLVELRMIGGTAAHGMQRGLALCLVTAAAVKLGDSTAYFVGRMFGRSPLCWVSPKKTWEGALASSVGSVAAAVLLGAWFGFDERVVAGLGLVASLAGQGGDLVESYVKRALGVKDSAPTFGEMGGLLDMLDALLLAAPAAYLWCELLIVRDGLPG